MQKNNENSQTQSNGVETVVSRTQSQEVWRRLKKNKGAMIGLGFLIFLIIITISGDFIFDYDADVISMNPANSLQSPSKDHWFGTDNFGRDIFARVIYGARYSVFIAVGSVTIGLIIGVITGALAGYYGGIVDQVVMRSNDILYAIPNIMIAVVIVSLFGTNIVNLLLALCVTVATSFTRITRSAVMTVKDQEYVEAAYAIGLPTWEILLKHILPNCISPIIVQTTLAVGTTIIAASSLSFLGIGVPSPIPEWGALLSEGRNFMRNSAHMTIIPGLAIMFTVLSLNLLGDGLRDALDPKLKE